MKYLELPTLDYLLDSESTAAFPYTKTFDEAINDPFCYLHTSGSTGLPKPIPWSHGLIGTMDAVRLLPPVGEFADLVPWTSDWNEGDKIYSSFPMSHVGQLCLYPCPGVKTDREAKEMLTDDFPHRALESS
jgi:long-subunit acyl-CoA synthetase (AMP-forming)